MLSLNDLAFRPAENPVRFDDTILDGSGLKKARSRAGPYVDFWLEEDGRYTLIDRTATTPCGLYNILYLRLDAVTAQAVFYDIQKRYAEKRDAAG